MKKYFSLLLLMVGLLTMQAAAQQPTLMPLIAGDTVVNTASVTKQFVTLSAGYSCVGMQFVLTKISGTVAGTTTPQVSMNGTNWFTLPGATAHTNTDVTTNTLGWSILGGSPWRYYRINCTGAGTMSAQLRVYYVYRKHD